MKARVRRNRYGNWYGYLGRKKVRSFFNSTTETQEEAASRWLKDWSAICEECNRARKRKRAA